MLPMGNLGILSIRNRLVRQARPGGMVGEAKAKKKKRCVRDANGRDGAVESAPPGGWRSALQAQGSASWLSSQGLWQSVGSLCSSSPSLRVRVRRILGAGCTAAALRFILLILCLFILFVLIIVLNK